jgi:ABC-type transporter Mla subunit MlaD
LRCWPTLTWQVQESDQQLRAAVGRLEHDCAQASAAVSRLGAELAAAHSEGAHVADSVGLQQQRQAQLEDGLRALDARAAAAEDEAAAASAAAEQRWRELQVRRASGIFQDTRLQQSIWKVRPAKHCWNRIPLRYLTLLCACRRAPTSWV